MPTWTRRLLGAGVLAALLAAHAACAALGAGAGGTADFTLRDVDGRQVRLSDYAGRDVVLIAFWATWCGPCAGELVQLERLYRAYRGQGLAVLAVAMDGPESVAEVAPFARRHGLTFPVLLDEDTRVAAVWNPRRSAPYSVLLARDGRIVRRKEGFAAGDEEALRGAIRAEVAARP